MVEIKRVIALSLLVVNLILAFSSCDTSEMTDSAKKVEDGLTFVENGTMDKFIALYKEGTSVLKFEAIQQDEVIKSRVYYNDSNILFTQITIPDNRKAIPNLVNDAAFETRTRLASQKISAPDIVKFYSSLMQALNSRMFEVKNLELASSITFHNAIIKTAERLNNDKNRYKGKVKPCTSYAGFTEGSDPFVCLEDMVMKIETFEKRLKQRGLSFSDFGIEDEIENLKNHKKIITGKEFSDIAQKNTENTRARYPYPFARKVHRAVILDVAVTMKVIVNFVHQNVFIMMFGVWNVIMAYYVVLVAVLNHVQKIKLANEIKKSPNIRKVKTMYFNST